jgi:hypothetical protein
MAKEKSIAMMAVVQTETYERVEKVFDHLRKNSKVSLDSVFDLAMRFGVAELEKFYELSKVS